MSDDRLLEAVRLIRDRLVWISWLLAVIATATCVLLGLVVGEVT